MEELSVASCNYWYAYILRGNCRQNSTLKRAGFGRQKGWAHWRWTRRVTDIQQKKRPEKKNRKNYIGEEEMV